MNLYTSRLPDWDRYTAIHKQYKRELVLCLTMFRSYVGNGDITEVKPASFLYATSGMSLAL